MARDESHTITIEEYRAAEESKDLAVLRRTGTDMSAHAPMPESQVCGGTLSCDGVYVCAKHRTAPSR